jgi:hypothetical protein
VEKVENKQQQNPKQTGAAKQCNFDAVFTSWATSNNQAFWIPCEDG